VVGVATESSAADVVVGAATSEDVVAESVVGAADSVVWPTMIGLAVSNVMLTSWVWASPFASVHSRLNVSGEGVSNPAACGHAMTTSFESADVASVWETFAHS